MLNVKRIAGRKDCGNCYRPFEPFEITNYLGIDNNSFCTACRNKIAPGAPDDKNDLYGGWVKSIYIGNHDDDKRYNVLRLIELYNESLMTYDSHKQIIIKE